MRFHAHAIWCIKNGETLIAFAVKANHGEKGELNRFVNEEKYEESVDAARNFLTEEVNNYDKCALYYDGYFRFSENDKSRCNLHGAKWKVDGEIKSLVMAVPYQKKKFLRKLKIYKPKIVRSNNIDDKTLDRGLEEFRNGISKHEKGAEVWNKFIDQSR